MCVGALLESRVRALVFAVPDPENGAAGSVIQLARAPEMPHQLSVVSGVRESEARRLAPESASV
jgi:tRNA(adenine34) deaminase